MIEVHAAPPAKDGAKSIRAETHTHHVRVRALREAMARLEPDERFEGVPLRLEMTVSRLADRSDALNAINGVADIIQRRGNPEQPWLIDDDANIREFTYREVRGNAAFYTVRVTAIS